MFSVGGGEFFLLLRFIAAFVMTFFSLNTYSYASSIKPSPEQEQEIVAYLHQLYNARSQYLMNKDEQVLSHYYLVTERSSRYALQQEKIRMEYIHAWALHRKLHYKRAVSDIRVPRIRMEGNYAKATVIHSQKLEYAYNDSHSMNQSFGIGTRHALTLIKDNGHWFVLREWYSDPLNENPKLISKADEHFPNLHIQQPSNTPETSIGTRRYNRERALAYANKYAGAAWGAGNHNRYNRKYRDYTSQGGDCTNFASQVIGDPDEGGGLRMTSNWQYWFKAGGSHSWVQTDRFNHFLQYSGYARVIGSGTFEKITQSTKKYPYGVIGQLKPGDLIAYILHGDDVDHFGILVGYDEYGYPLVNSHTADRYRVPFDLGWDQYTRYTLIHIKD